ncbi:MAG: acyl--CoA ligase [Candidatus Aureabacteria bacterium]|nr:acyl--CoA ligase [Candidatus Auribacterota bacterium]
MLFENPRFNDIIFNGKTYTNEILTFSIDALASFLDKKCLSSSPFIHLISYNHIKTLIAYFAIIKTGRIVVLIDPETGGLELDEILKDAPPAAFFYSDNKQEEWDYQKEILFYYGKPRHAGHELDDVCTMVYTAADDGFTKAAMLTKKGMASNAAAVVEADCIGPDTISCAIIPFHHLYGLQTGLLGPVSGGGKMVIQDISSLTKIKTIADAVETHTVTNLYTTPVIYYLLMKYPEIKQVLKSVKSCVSGAHKLPVSLFNHFLEKTGIELHEGYGLTEASPICTWHRPGDKIKPESVGRAFPGCRVVIMDQEGSELPADQIGEVCVQGDNVMKGYYLCEETTRSVLNRGWLHTGDLGKLDEDGYLYLTGLKKRMLNVGGKKVYPAEVERFFKKNEQVKNAEITGVSHEFEGDVVKGRVELVQSDERNQKAFIDWCKKNMSHYKIPSRIEFY